MYDKTHYNKKKSGKKKGLIVNLLNGNLYTIILKLTLPDSPLLIHISEKKIYIYIH